MKKQAVNKILDEYYPKFLKLLKLKPIALYVGTTKQFKRYLSLDDSAGVTKYSIKNKNYTTFIAICWNNHHTKKDVIDTLLHELIHVKFINLNRAFLTSGAKRTNKQYAEEELLVRLFTKLLMRNIDV